MRLRRRDRDPIWDADTELIGTLPSNVTLLPANRVLTDEDVNALKARFREAMKTGHVEILDDNSYPWPLNGGLRRGAARFYAGIWPACANKLSEEIGGYPQPEPLPPLPLVHVDPGTPCGWCGATDTLKLPSEVTGRYTPYLLCADLAACGNRCIPDLPGPASESPAATTDRTSADAGTSQVGEPDVPAAACEEPADVEAAGNPGGSGDHQTHTSTEDEDPS